MYGDAEHEPDVIRRLPEPVGPLRRMHPMRSEPNGLNDLADRARLDELSSLDGGATLEALAVHDRVDALRLGLYAPHVRKLIERRDAGLVGHEVLSVLHHANAERCTLHRNAGGPDELDRGILQNLALVLRNLHVRISFGERSAELGLLREKGDELAAALRGRVDLAVDVAVIDPDHGEPETRDVATMPGGPNGCAKLRRQKRGRRQGGNESCGGLHDVSASKVVHDSLTVGDACRFGRNPALLPWPAARGTFLACVRHGHRPEAYTPRLRGPPCALPLLGDRKSSRAIRTCF